MAIHNNYLIIRLKAGDAYSYIHFYTNPNPTNVGLLDRLAITFNSVEFGDAIGEGRNYRVYKGHWKSKNTGVAIKTLSGGLKEDEVSTAAGTVIREIPILMVSASSVAAAAL